MCNIAGYVGTKQAAPILLDMLKKQEGYGGGYYSGIATIHEGKIYYAKLTGDVQKLTEETEASRLPGTVGIIHSRSKSGGGDEWAHPFVGVRDGQIKTAYVANGSVGFFANQASAFNGLADQLVNEGYQLFSRIVIDGAHYQKLLDGTSVHMSDVMCQLIMRNLENGEQAPFAMEKAFCEMPSEIVGLLLHLEDPDVITWSRINMPMSVGFCSHGAYLATTAIAFPEDAGEPQLLPVCSSGQIYRDHYTVFPYQEKPAKVAVIDARVRQEAYEKVCMELREGKQKCSYLCKAIAPLFEPADCVPDAPLVYDILDSLMRQGRLQVEHCQVPGVFEGMKAPEFRMYLKEE